MGEVNLVCCVCKKDGAKPVGPRKVPLHDGECRESFEEYAAPKPNHSRLEHDQVHGKFGQRDGLVRDPERDEEP